MARTFRRPRTSQPIAELNVTNLIDLGFLLLIIFMITTSSSKEEQTIPVHLPEQSKQLQAKPDPDLRFVTASVDARGQYYLDNKPMGVLELRDRLKSMGAEPKPPVIRVRGDGAVTYDKIIGLVDEIQRANLHQLTFDTQIRP